MFPDWSQNLRQLYWFRRMARPASTPTVRTWQRRIQREKRRLLEAGVCPFELHAVCRVLMHPSCETSAARLERIMQATVAT